MHGGITALFSSALLASAMLTVHAQSIAAPQAGTPVPVPLPFERVQALLPPAGVFDLDGEAYEATHRELVEAGERAFPALVRALEQEDDLTRAAFIMRAFVVAKGNKAMPRAALTKLLKDAGARGWPASLRSSMVVCATEALGQIGEVADTPVLLGLVRDEQHAVRTAVAEALGQLGDEATARALELAAAERFGRLTGVEAAEDRSLQAVHEAVARIRFRMLVQSMTFPATATAPAGR